MLGWDSWVFVREGRQRKHTACQLHCSCYGWLWVQCVTQGQRGTCSYALNNTYVSFGNVNLGQPLLLQYHPTLHILFSVTRRSRSDSVSQWVSDSKNRVDPFTLLMRHWLNTNWSDSCKFSDLEQRYQYILSFHRGKPVWFNYQWTKQNQATFCKVLQYTYNAIPLVLYHTIWQGNLTKPFPKKSKKW